MFEIFIRLYRTIVQIFVGQTVGAWFGYRQDIIRQIEVLLLEKSHVRNIASPCRLAVASHWKDLCSHTFFIRKP